MLVTANQVDTLAVSLDLNMQQTSRDYNPPSELMGSAESCRNQAKHSCTTEILLSRMHMMPQTICPFTLKSHSGLRDDGDINVLHSQPLFDLVQLM